MTSGGDMREARARMLDRQLVRRGIKDARVLDAMGRVPRELFVPRRLRAQSYDDTALRIAVGQTISQPYVVALMLQLAGIATGDRVLEVGAGSGYGAAVMSRLARHVTAIERHRRLVSIARANLARAGIDNVTVILGDGTLGRPEAAPFDAIIVSAGGKLPDALKAQLAIGGRLVMPVGNPADAPGAGPQTLVRITRRGTADFQVEEFGAVAFVPLVADTHTET